MTRDEAAKIITSSMIAATDEDLILAERLATALDALGLLNFAAAWERISPANRRLVSQSIGDITNDALTRLDTARAAAEQVEHQLSRGNVNLKCDPGNFGAVFTPDKADT